jgi:hypothetical protein
MDVIDSGLTTSSSLIKKIALLKGVESVNTKTHYRFGDVINHGGFYWKESTKFILNQDDLKNSILRTYIECCPNNNLNIVNPDKIKLLYNIIKYKIENEIYKLPTDDELVIHLRTGDVVECAWYLKKNYIQIIQNHVNMYNIKKVTFCTAFHYGNNIKQQCFIYTPKKHIKNIKKLNEIFTKVLTRFKHLQFDVKSSKNIDDDFIYMTMSKYFVEDHGGFSNLIKKIIHYKKQQK